MSSPSSAICPRAMVAEAIKSAVIGDVQEPYGATFCSGIRCPLILHRHSRLLIGSIPARGLCTMLLCAGEWLRLLTYEIADVARIAREGALVQLAPVPGVHEELDRTAQGVDRAREAARAAAQTRQIVTQLGIVGLDAVGLTLARRDSVC